MAVGCSLYGAFKCSFMTEMQATCGDETVSHQLFLVSLSCGGLRGQFELSDVATKVCRFSFHVRSPSMTAASQIKEVLAGCGLIKLLICLCIIVWILTSHTAIEPPKVLHYAANSNISSFYNYSTDTFIFMSIFMMCSVIGFPSSWRKKRNIMASNYLM